MLALTCATGIDKSASASTKGSPDSAPQDQAVDNADTGRVMTALTSLLNTLIKHGDDYLKGIQSIKLGHLLVAKKTLQRYKKSSLLF